ncbi:hypothetical protein [Pseudobacteriovorax antillogorgiicola]|uniref:Peptidase C1A papain C-terminal domain-containing protein n=1 Tax=Pseudobacteriovorax antillogorgiicola TaxID=1513793 RepID=A0A1Y6BAG5_9BACT|nr:hypothetical protein [Pseudobacteriovorax antillogorgiicola]TCS57400.1 hypothetical protein EDD56_103140 [Pseudobacteriovorax antillogorgiicola]SMF01574.1 hypothetical protein SAMN06296036_103193 [Pseudobacteriovorax antillogorgiicola]
MRRFDPRLLGRTLLAVGAISLSACGQKPSAEVSLPLVTDVDHTEVKRQAIGNCWLYAQASWLESLHQTATGQSFDASESYWTYWHWYEQILNAANRGRNIQEIQTGGNWYTAQSLLRRYGILAEGDFIRYDQGREMSVVQGYAQNYVDTALASGALANIADRTPQNIKAVLNAAFSVNMDEKQALATSIYNFQVATGRDLDQVTVVSEIMNNWRQYSLSRYQDESVLRYVKRALNDGQPVVMSMWVDFRYLNTETATFQGSIYDPSSDGDGGHMVVLEDYVVDHPELGIIGEGDMDDSIKQKALEGELVYLKAKNSWGTNRPGRGLTDGYTRFDMEWLLETSRDEIGYQYTSFVLPIGIY